MQQGLRSLLGCSRDEIAAFDHPEHLARTFGAIDEALFKEGSPQFYETKIACQRTGTRDVVFNKAVFTNDVGEPAGLIGAIVDITGRKQAEQKLKEALEFAEGVVAAIPDWTRTADTSRSGRRTRTCLRSRRRRCSAGPSMRCCRRIDPFVGSPNVLRYSC